MLTQNIFSERSSTGLYTHYMQSILSRWRPALSETENLMGPPTVHSVHHGVS